MGPNDVLQDSVMVLLTPSLKFIYSVCRFSLNAVVRMVTKIPWHLGRFIGTRIGTSSDPPTSVSIGRNNTCNVAQLHQSIDSQRHKIHETVIVDNLNQKQKNISNVTTKRRTPPFMRHAQSVKIFYVLDGSPSSEIYNLPTSIDQCRSQSVKHSFGSLSPFSVTDKKW